MSDSSHDYDSVKIRVDPDELQAQAKQLEQHSKVVGEYLDDINSTLRELKLNWAGQTSQEFEDITNQWSQVVDKLFGNRAAGSKESEDSELSADDGVLRALAVGVRNTASNFAHADHNAKEMFDQMFYALNDTMSEEPSEPTDSLDRDDTAISANYATDFSDGDKENLEKQESMERAGAEGADLDSYVDHYGGVNKP